MMNTADTYQTAGTAGTCGGNGGGFRVNGTDATSGYSGYGAGYTVAHGDVNCDGIPDLVIGAPNAKSNAGAVYVIFGTAGGFANPLSVGSLNGTNGITITASGSSWFGQSLAVGDIDNDGCADIVVGDTSGNGNIYILYGASYLKSATTSYDLATISSGGSTCEVTNFWTDTVSPAMPIDALAIGDVNGDGKNDLIMGCLGCNGSKGYVYAMFGVANTCTGANHSGATPTYAYGLDPTRLTHTGVKLHDNSACCGASPDPTGLRINGPTALNAFGGVLAIGDVDSNGTNDILIGAGGYNNGQGRLYAVFGQSNAAGKPWNTADNITAGGLVTNGANTVSSGTIATPAGFIINGTSPPGGTDFTQGGIASGDLTGDSIADIVAGSLSSGKTPNIGYGYAWVIPGMSNPNWQAYGTGPFNLTTMVSGNKAYQFSTAENLGTWVGTGDINKDGKLDLLIGDQGVTVNGSVFVLFGPISAGVNLDSSPPNGTTGFRADCPASANGSCGLSVDTADLNNDGNTDVVICSQQANVTGNNEEGWCYVLFGKSSGWTSTYSLSTIY